MPSSPYLKGLERFGNLLLLLEWVVGTILFYRRQVQTPPPETDFPIRKP